MSATRMLVSSIVLGVGAGLAFGGRVQRLAHLQIGWWPILAVAVALRLAAPLFGTAALIVYLVAFVGVIFVALTNRALPGMYLIAGGSALNLVVVALNGAMPVDPVAIAAVGAAMPNDPLHVELGPNSVLPFLADVIPVPLVRGAYSAGDVLLAGGGFWLPFAWLRRP